MARAMREGRDAARDGEPISNCPYDHRDVPRGRVMAVLWCRAHNKAVPPPVSYE